MYVFLIALPEISAYYLTNVFCSVQKVFNSEIMSRNRFQSIMKFLRFSSPAPYEEKKSHHATSSLFCLFVRSLSICLDPGEHFIVDVCLNLYKGRTSFMIYIKDKKSRFEVKLISHMSKWSKVSCIYAWNFPLLFWKGHMRDSIVSWQFTFTIFKRILVFLA